MVDEPEMRIRFQYKMSLKTWTAKGATGRCMLRVDEHHHAGFGATEFGRNEGLRRGEPEGALVDGDARGNLWLDGGHPTPSAVSEIEQRTKRYCAPISVKVTGLSRAQMTRLVGCWMKQRCIPRK